MNNSCKMSLNLLSYGHFNQNYHCFCIGNFSKIGQIFNVRIYLGSTVQKNSIYLNSIYANEIFVDDRIYVNGQLYELLVFRRVHMYKWSFTVPAMLLSFREIRQVIVRLLIIDHSQNNKKKKHLCALRKIPHSMCLTKSSTYQSIARASILQYFCS